MMRLWKSAKSRAYLGLKGSSFTTFYARGDAGFALPATAATGLRPAAWIARRRPTAGVLSPSRALAILGR
jgi:hypothetical protein